MSNGTEVATRSRRDAPKSLVQKFAGRFGVEPEKLLATLKATAFRTGPKDPPVSNEEMLGLLVVADQHNLNPFTKEIYAFRDQKGGIMPIISVDGWIRLMQEQRTFQGIEFKYDEEGEWVEATITRSDRAKPFTVREYMVECQRNTGPWQQSPQRMLRHRALIQCCRVAFGFGGIYGDDEGEQIALAAGIDLLPINRPHIEPPAAKHAESPLATDDQLEALREKIGVTGVDTSFLLARFEIGKLEELRSDQIPDAMKFCSDNGGPPPKGK